MHKILKVREKTSAGGKKYFLVTLEGLSKEASCFDYNVAKLVGQEVEATITEGTYGPKMELAKGNATSQTSGGFVKEGTQDKNNERKYSTTLSYAKDVLLGIATTYLAKNPEFTPDMALRFIEDALPGVHDVFLERLAQLEKN